MKNGTPALVAIVIVVLLVVAGLIFMVTVRHGQDESHQVHQPGIITGLRLDTGRASAD